MSFLEMESPDLAGTQSEAGREANIRRGSTDRMALQAARHRGPRLLIVFASWLVRMEHRMREREILSGWDAALSLKLDHLTDIRERLAQYNDSERRGR